MHTTRNPVLIPPSPAQMGHINLTAASAPELDRTLRPLLECLSLAPGDTSSGGRVPPPMPLVGVIMGSDSDLPAMSAACDILRKFDVAFECDIVSAHRTPEKMMAYAKDAASRGLQVSAERAPSEASACGSVMIYQTPAGSAI